MNLLEVTAASHRGCTKGTLERLAERQRALQGFGAVPAHVQGRVTAAGEPTRHEIAE